MKSAEIKMQTRQALVEVIKYADELRDLDQALGDGDLGITVSVGAKAVIEALDQLDSEALPSEIAKVAAKAFSNANPSTMSALVAGALLAGSRVWADKTEISQQDASSFIRAGGDNIAVRGKTQLGDKTMLDVIMPAADAIATAPDAAAGLDAAIAAAQRAVVETMDLQSHRGRASWLQERSIGLRDPGAVAILRFLESWKAANA